VARAAVRGRLSWQVARVESVVDETPRVRTLVLDVPEWAGHRAGQHLDVRLTAEDGYRAERSYSIASPPGEPVAITVERLDNGACSGTVTIDMLQDANSDGRLDPQAVEHVRPYFADPSIGAVQIGVRINNREQSRLARMQDMEFVIYTEVFQRGRRHLERRCSERRWHQQRLHRHARIQGALQALVDDALVRRVHVDQHESGAILRQDVHAMQLRQREAQRMRVVGGQGRRCGAVAARPEESGVGEMQPCSASAAVSSNRGLRRNFFPRGVMGWGFPWLTESFSSFCRSD
jgi:hypothetical protein